MNILREAEETSFAREKDYDPPESDFTCIAAMWDAVLEKRTGGIGPELVPLFMILVKVSRLVNNPEHRDSIVDIAGYAQALQLLNDHADRLSPLPDPSSCHYCGK